MTEHHNKDVKVHDSNTDHADEPHNFKYYSRPENFAKILQNKKSIFGIWGLVGYLGHFFLIIIGLNLYCDNDRHLKCGTKGLYPDGSEENSKYYDIAFILLISYHMIEWVRVIGLMVTMILGQNFIKLYYITGVNSLFGIAAYITCHVRRFNSDGQACAET